MRGVWVLSLSLIACGGASQSTTVAHRPTPPVYTPVPLPGSVGGGPQMDLTGMEMGPSGPIEKYVNEKTELLRQQCYTPSSGVVTFVIEATVAPDGTVRQASTTSVNGDPTIAECVRARMQGWTFPRTDEGGSFSFNFLFGR